MTTFILPIAEDQQTEFKAQVSNLSREIVAFANAQGGRIFIGLNDDGSPSALRIDNRTRSAIIDELENCEPRPPFELIEQDGILILEIKEGEHKPYRAPEGFFLRVGASSRKLKRDEILTFAVYENRIQFDSQTLTHPFRYIESELFSPSLFGVFRERSRLLSPLDDVSLLKNIGLITAQGEETYCTNALVLLFAREATKFFPHARVIIWEMRDPTSIIDQRIVTGDLFSQLSETLGIVQSKLRQGYEIRELAREVIPEFPETILRELIVNALIHRDYFERGAEVQIKILPSAIEISNPGKPLYGTDPSKLIGRSLRRNPLLAEIFQRAGFVERAGTGLLRVERALIDLGRPPLSLTVEGEFFVASLSREIDIPSSKTLSPRQRSIISLLHKRRSISSSELAAVNGISARQVRKDLAELCVRRLVAKVKQGRTVRYQLTDKKR